MDPAEGHFWYITDYLGSTRRLESTGMQRDYYPFGEDYLAAGSETEYQFTGKELDSGSGLYYFGARYYDPRIGRWLTVDPQEEYPSPYLYVGNNPLVLVGWAPRPPDCYSKTKKARGFITEALAFVFFFQLLSYAACSLFTEYFRMANSNRFLKSSLDLSILPDSFYFNGLNFPVSAHEWQTKVQSGCSDNAVWHVRDLIFWNFG